MKQSVPQVSVLMGVFNCEATLTEAVESIKAQTFTDWEFIICDDGSKDGTLALARDHARRDSRIKVIANSKNLGLAATLNHCARHAQGCYLARMDGDDISEPHRFAKLVKVLQEKPEIAVVSSWMICFDEKGPWGEVKTKAEPTSRDFISGTPFCHAPCMMRREVFESLGGYSEKPWANRVEDYNLWFRLYAAGYKGVNLQEPLYRMRNDSAATRRRNFKARWHGVVVRWKGFGLLGYPWWKRLWAIKPILVWLLPGRIYEWIYRLRRGIRKNSPITH
jgi:glycosyltransferase EpsE